MTTQTIAISGSSGLVGTALTEALESHGHTVRRIVRHEVNDPQREIFWRPSAGQIDATAFAEVDTVVHLAGENIAEGRWNDAKKQRIRDSRVDGTRLISEALAGLDQRPRALVSASAIGYYGDRGNETLDESAPPGDGFLPEVCRAWEAATQAAAEAGLRVAHLRTGVVLSPKGGALAKMLLPFKLGLGGKIGSGEQYMSWITLRDEVAAIEHVIFNEEITGAVNLTAPNPATNVEYTKTLGRVLGRPTIFPMPAFAARLAFGEMADALLLASARVIPQRLNDSPFTFQDPTLEAALQHVLNK